MWLKVGGPSLWAAHKGKKVGGPRPARPNSFRRQWQTAVIYVVRDE